MKPLSSVLWGAYFAVFGLLLQSCGFITLPLTTTLFGGASLAIKGAELQKEISKADVRKSFDRPFEQTWNTAAIALVNLRIEIINMGKTPEGDGGLIEGRVKERKVKVIAIEFTENITEVGIWTEYNQAFAELIAEKIKEELQKQGHPIQGIGSEVE